MCIAIDLLNHSLTPSFYLFMLIFYNLKLSKYFLFELIMYNFMVILDRNQSFKKTIFKRFWSLKFYFFREVFLNFASLNRYNILRSNMHLYNMHVFLNEGIQYLNFIHKFQACPICKIFYDRSTRPVHTNFINLLHSSPIHHSAY